MARKTGNYDDYHIEWLKEPENAAAFLNAVIGSFLAAFLAGKRPKAMPKIKENKMETIKALGGTIKFQSSP